MNRSVFLFRDLHYFAQQIEQHAFLQKVYKGNNKQKYLEATKEIEKNWKLMEEWKKSMEDEMKGKTGRIFWG